MTSAVMIFPVGRVDVVRVRAAQNNRVFTALSSVFTTLRQPCSGAVVNFRAPTTAPAVAQPRSRSAPAAEQVKPQAACSPQASGGPPAGRRGRCRPSSAPSTPTRRARRPCEAESTASAAATP